MEKEHFDYDGWIQKGKVRISDLQSGKTFTLTSLFSTEWDEIPKNYRKSFGAKFAKSVENGEIVGVEKIDKERRGPNQYRRV